VRDLSLEDDPTRSDDAGAGFLAIFALAPDLWVVVEPIAGATRLHLFSPADPDASAEYDYDRAFDALRDAVAMSIDASSEPAGPWHRRRIGPCVERRAVRLND
jgi:hypothetical protein